MTDNQDNNPILKAERRRFLRTALGGLAGLGIAGAAAGSAFAAPFCALVPTDDSTCTTTTVVTNGPRQQTIAASTIIYTKTGTPPFTGTTTAIGTNLGTLVAGGTNPWSATYSFTGIATVSASGSVRTATLLRPSYTTAVTFSKTATTPCSTTADSTTDDLVTVATTMDELQVRAGDPVRSDDIDLMNGFGDEVHLA